MVYSVRNLTFNQDKSCFACAMDEGARLYNAEPLAEKCRLEANSVGSLAKVFMHNRSNLVAMVGGGLHPKFPSNVVKIWDNVLKQFHMQYRFGEDVLNVLTTKNKIVFVLKTQTYVFTFPSDSKKLLEVETKSNPFGLGQVSPSPDRQLLATLGHKTGSLQLIDLTRVGQKDSCSPITINAHQSDIACLAMNHQGTLVATASEKGTLIRLFDTQSRQKLVELRRGSDHAVLHCINFSRDSSYLCAASDKGTVHIFALKDTDLNRRSAFAKAGKVSPFQDYTSSQWSFCCFTVPPECPCACVFGSGNSVIAVCVDGTYHKYSFNIEGNCNREAYNVYLDLEDESDF